MSYIALYRKYRPSSLEEVAGQDHIVKSIKYAVENNKISHAYLFVGPRGTGKTTTARLLAKAVNCIDPYGAEDKWAKCKSYSPDAMDIIEIDAASNNGVEAARKLIEQARYLPSVDRYKVYIIDEVHMMTKSAFNALLKLMEEPPAHVIFILATTEPEKIPLTIISRTQRYNFNRVSDSSIVNVIEKTLKKEGVSYEDFTLSKIAEISRGSLRDAMTMIDQLINFSQGHITNDSINDLFGIISHKSQVVFLNALFKGETAKVIAWIHRIHSQGKDVKILVESLIQIINEWIIYKKTNDMALISKVSKSTIESVTITVHFAYNASEELIKLLDVITNSYDPKTYFELVSIRLADGFKNIPANRNKTIDSLDNLTTADLETKQIEVFATEKINVNDQQEADLLETRETEAENTMISDTLKEIENEFSITEEIDITKNTVIETDAANNDVEENIISVDFEDEEPTDGKIDLNEIFKSTDEINITPEVKVDIDEVVNMLLQAKKDFREGDKNNLLAPATFVRFSIETAYATLFQLLKFISSGESFVIVTSENEEVIQEIRTLEKKKEFWFYIDRLFGRQVHLRVITKQEFESIKSNWSTQYKNRDVIQVNMDREKEVTENDKIKAYGQQLFGDHFSEGES